MKHNQELLEGKKVLVRGIETLEGKLKDIMEGLLQMKEKLQGNDYVINHGRNMKDDTDGYESERNTSEENIKQEKGRMIQMKEKQIRKYELYTG